MIDRKILLGLILVLVATCYDLTRSYLTTTSNETTTDGSTSSSFNSHSDELYAQSSAIPPPKMKMHTIPTIKFLFCYS